MVPYSIKGEGPLRNRVKQYKFVAQGDAILLNMLWVSAEGDICRNVNINFDDEGTDGVCTYGIDQFKIHDGPDLASGNGPMKKQFFANAVFDKVQKNNRTRYIALCDFLKKEYSITVKDIIPEERKPFSKIYNKESIA